jgi:tripartite-type tricarboxylate transporter receptor subunit TctC
MTVDRRALLGSIAAGIAATSCPDAFGQDSWPSRPVRLVSPYGAGGASDISLRILAEYLGQNFKQQFYVENKPGAGTRIANETVARAQGDGYTFLYAAAPFATAGALFGKLSYDPRKDLRPVAMAVIAPIFLVVNAQRPFQNVPDLIAFGKSRAEGLTFGSPGVGSQPHLAAELLFREAHVKGLNVPFRGDQMAYTELLADRIDATLTAISTALPHIRDGKLRVLAVASVERSALYPEAPTFQEQGFPSIVGAGWYGFLAPASTPKEIVDQIESAINRGLGDESIKRKLIAQGLEARGGSAASFRDFIESEATRWGEVIQKAGIKGE